MRLAALLAFVLLIAAPHAAVGQPSVSEMKDHFREAFQWIEDNALHSNNGLLLRKADIYQARLRDGDPFKGVRFTVTDGCVQIDGDGECLDPGQAVGPSLPHWHVTSISANQLRLNYANARFNAFIARSLLRMYHAAGEPSYLARAGRQVERLLGELDEHRWIRLRVGDSGPRYIARLNSMVIQAVYRYARAVGEPDWSPLVKMARAYTFTDEGTWNHWQGAVLGQFVAARVLDEPVGNLPSLRQQMDQLQTQIERHRGKIPYVMSESHPTYPDFRPTYQTLSTMYLAKMSAETTLNVDVPSSHLWPLVWAEAIEATNTKTYWANNTATALHLLKGTDRVYDDWMIHQAQMEIYREAPTTLREAVSKLRGVSSLAKYWSIRRGLSNLFPSVVAEQEGPTPNPVSSTARLSLLLTKRAEVKVDLYDALGRRVKALRQAEVPKRTWFRQRVDVRSLSAGTYFIRVQVRGQSCSYKLTVL